MDKQWDIDRIDVPLALAFGNHLDALETKIVYSASNKIFQEEVTFGNHLVNWVITAIGDTKNDALWLTVLKTYSFLYRVGPINGGLKPLTADKEELVLKLTTALKAWKEGIEQFIEKGATPNDQRKIGELSRFHGFSESLLKAKEMKETCFSLIFKENFPIDVLVQYIKTSTVILKEALLAMRIGLQRKFGVEMLKIQQDESKKNLKLLMNGKNVSILDPKKKIKMNGDRIHTWKEIQEMGQRGKTHPLEIEMFSDVGLILFRPQGLQYPINATETARIDTTAPNYWDHKEFHPFLMASQNQVEKMLEITISDVTPCVVSVEASCLDPYNVDHAHGNSTVYLKRDDGRYQIIPCGKYAADFPQTEKEKASFLGNTVEAEFTCPDPNLTYAYRMLGIWRRQISVQEAEKWLERYGKRIWHFQFANNNCSADFQCLMEEKYGKEEEGGTVPNFFRLPVLEARSFPLSYLFDPLSVLPSSITTFLLHGLHVVLGSKREYTKNDGSEIVSLYDSEYTKNETLYVPGMLVYRILTGEIDGVVRFGYD